MTPPPPGPGTPVGDDDDDDRTVIRPPVRPGPSPSLPPSPPSPVAADDGGALPLPPASSSSLPPGQPLHGNALPVGIALGEFEITRVLGEGGFGIVYLATDHSLERKVALKEYMPAGLASRGHGTQVSVRSERHRDTFETGRRSFVNEARLLAQFDHPSLVKVYRFWEANGTAYMVMPFYEGRTLKDVLRDLGAPPDEAWLAGLLAPLTEALAVIHAAHCYHRDIAPDNILLLAGSQRPLLLDFGAARRVIGDMTQSLTVILKPGYAPIEQYAEVPSLRQGPWTDLYALAAVMHFAITGRTPPAAVGRMVDDPYVPLAISAAGRYGERFLRALDRALRVRPEERPQTVQTMRADLGFDGDDGPAAGASSSSGFGGSRTGTPAASGPPGPARQAGDAGARPAGGAATAAAASVPGGSPVFVPGAAATSAPGVAAASASGGAGASSQRWLPVAGLVALAVGGVAAYFTFGTRPAPTPMPTTAPVAGPATPATPAASAVAAAPAPALPGIALPATPRAVPPAAPTVATPSPSSSSAAGPAGAAAPTPAPSPAAVPRPPAPPTGIAGFDQVLAAQSPEVRVEAAPSRPRLRIGRDKLAFTVISSHDGYLDVLLRGPDGSFVRLFPNSVAKGNRIRAGRALTLPTAAWALEATAPAGREDFLVIVSAAPRDFAAAGRGRDGWFLKLPSPDAAPAAGGTLPVWAGRVACPAVNPACDLFGAAHFTIDVVR